MGHPELEQGHRLLRAGARRALGLPVDGNSFDDGMTRRLALALASLSARLVAPAAGNAPAPRYLESPEDRAAYLAGLAPRTLAAVDRELPALPAGAVVLDLGAGTGAASLAAVLRGARTVHLVDHSGAALQEAGETLRAAGAQDVRVHVGALGDAVGWPPGKVDLVLLAFSLLEAARDDAGSAGALLRAAAQRVNERGFILVVDSAQKARARVLNGLRPVLLEQGFHLWSPCPHAGPCPALERERDFCHAAAPWELPEDLQQVGERAGLHRHRLAYAFLLAGRQPRPGAPPPVRVMGDVQEEKGRARVAVCTAGPVRELVALQRHKQAHAALCQLSRGAGLALPLGAERMQRVEDAALLREVP